MKGPLFAILFASLYLPASVPVQTARLMGDWAEPGGSVIRVETCSTGLCMKLVFISPTAKGTSDFNNPSEALRKRPLCGLQIGSNFKAEDSSRATGGTLYDPKTGKTYRGIMTLDGANLKLRGYVGTPIFGRTEVWPSRPCRHSHMPCRISALRKRSCRIRLYDGRRGEMPRLPQRKALCKCLHRSGGISVLP